jgi:hypothetical protein
VHSVVEHSIDNGFVMVGQTVSYGAGNWDCILVKTNSVGVEQWTKTYGTSMQDIARSVIEHSIDDGLVVCGDSMGFGAQYQVLLVKTNTLGVTQWASTYGGASVDYGNAVIEHSLDNGLVVAVDTFSFGVGGWDFMLIKTNSVGVELWSKTYGGGGEDRGKFVTEHSFDSGLVIVGDTQTYGAGGVDTMLVKTNSVGVKQWTKVCLHNGDVFLSISLSLIYIYIYIYIYVCMYVCSDLWWHWRRLHLLCAGALQQWSGAARRLHYPPDSRGGRPHGRGAAQRRIGLSWHHSEYI